MNQVEYWNGPTGNKWAAAQESMDHTLRPLGIAAMDALDLAAGHRVLDVGCGCGDTVLGLAERVGPTGRVVGLDVSAPMLALARTRVDGSAVTDRVRLQLGDAAVAPLPEVDRLFSRFGTMFFEDPVPAFVHLRSALASGGRIGFVCWRSPAENPWTSVTVAAVTGVLGPQPRPDPHAPGPFAFAAPDRVRGILRDAGVVGIAIDRVDRELQWTSSPDEDVIREKFLQIGPAARLLADAPPDQRARAADAVLEAMRPHVRADGLWLTAAAWLVTGRTRAR